MTRLFARISRVREPFGSGTMLACVPEPEGF